MKIKSFAAAAIVALVAAPAFAVVGTGTTQDSMILRGAVAPILEVDLEPAPVASALDLTRAAEELAIGTVTMRSNIVTGYAITFTSANLGSLVADDPQNSDVLPYVLGYGDQGSFSLSKPATFEYLGERTPAEGVVRSLSVSYPQVWLGAGTYQDTVTVEIAAL